MTEHLGDFAPRLEKYKVVQIFFPCRKIEIRRTAIFWVIFSLN